MSDRNKIRSFGPETYCPYSAGVTVETEEEKWMRAFRKFQHFRMEHSLSVSHFFDLVNDSGTGLLCCRAFTKNTTSLIHIISQAEMAAWVKEMQKTAGKVGFIGPCDILGAATTYKYAFLMQKGSSFFRQTTLRGAVRHRQGMARVNDANSAKDGPVDRGVGLILWKDEHSQFPDWLSKRDDFQAHFAESESSGECPGLPLMMAACATVGSRRRPSQLALILRWMMYHRVLSHVSQPKLLDLCRKVKLLTVRKDTQVVVQNSPGDAFFMILDGRLSVEIDGGVVAALGEGMAFGERAIVNDMERAATVTSMIDCSLMVIQAADYKSLNVSARAVLNVELMNFVSTSCVPFKRLAYPDLYQASRCMHIMHFQGKQQIFQEGELSKGLFIVMNGTVHLSRRICPKDIVNDNFLLPSMRNEQAPHFRVLVDQANLGPGAVFGEECLRRSEENRSNNYNNSATATEACQLIFISACDVAVLCPYTVDKILEETEALHADNLSLVFQHQHQLKRKMALRSFQKAALKPMMAKRLMPKIIPSEDSDRKFSDVGLVAGRCVSGSRQHASGSRSSGRGSIGGSADPSGFLEELAEQDHEGGSRRSSRSQRALSPLPPTTLVRRSVVANEFPCAGDMFQCGISAVSEE